MNGDKKISIIVPIYNAEKYLKICVDSIINQTYSNIEILLVNDGSKDNSLELCKEYEKKDNRIRTIDKINGGPGSAKNAGVENATGDYIGFVDSDDYIENDMFEILYNLCEENNAEISMVDFRKIIDGKPMDYPNSTGEIVKYNRIHAMQKLLADKDIKNYSWNKLFKKQVFNNVRFPESGYYEDVEVTVKLLENINCLVHQKVCKYNYVQRDNSIVNSKSYDKLKDFVKVTKDRYEYLENKYEELNSYNAVGYVANMVLVYKYSIAYGIKELYEDFEKNYELFSKLVNTYKSIIFCELSDYRRMILSIIMWNRDIGQDVIKKIENV